jgi:hypothetical protein
MHGRSINECRRNDCRSYECRRNNCRSNETTPSLRLKTDDNIPNLIRSRVNELTFSEKELEEKNRSLNSKKAPDVYGITAEHLKYGGSTLVNYLTELLNNREIKFIIHFCVYFIYKI